MPFQASTTAISVNNSCGLLPPETVPLFGHRRSIRAVLKVVRVTFGEWIKQTREASGTKAVFCADRAGMSPQQWSDWENDRSRRTDESPAVPRPESIRAIARGLGVSESEVARAAGVITDGAAPSDSVSVMKQAVREVIREELTRDPVVEGNPWERAGFSDDGERWSRMTEEERESFRRLMDSVLAGRGDPRDQG